MIVLVVLSRKGGVGKSTVARSLAVQALIAGRRSALLDVDVQGTSNLWGRRREGTAPAVVHAGGKSVDSHVADLKKKGAQIVIIDTPPSVHPVINASVQASTSCLIATEVLPESLEQVSAMAALVANMDKPKGILLTRVPSRSSALSMAKSVLTAFNIPVCPTPMTNLIAHSYAAAEGQTIQEYAPSSKGSTEMQEIWKWLNKMKVV